jgi:hypothetical protein
MLTYLQILMGIMSGAFGLAGYYLGKMPYDRRRHTNIN